MSDIFKALADPVRRELLDRLRQRPGMTLTELEAPYDMTRFGVMRHLKILEAAGLVTTEKVGRNKHHFLNPVPLHEIQERWLTRFTSAAAQTLAELRHSIEGNSMESTSMERKMESTPSHVFEIYIRTTPEALWRALTDGEWTKRYYYDSVVSSSWEKGAVCNYHIEGRLALTGEVLEVEPPRRLVTTFDARWDDDVTPDEPTTITWEIVPQGPVCLLRVLHQGFTERTATFESVGGGMPWILSGLKTLLETGEEMAAA